MKFYFEKIILWMKNGQIRELEFKPNKVNILTGNSDTGKTTILNIIDYCFFASKNVKIPEKIINENVDWYGIGFHINDKKFTIARKSLDKRGLVSGEYYFSGMGLRPNIVKANIAEDKLKKIINNELSIDEKVVMPYGGNKIKAGSKISSRYFMMFNSQGENTIINSDSYFDKQTDEKYREALDRIFDLALGILTPQDVLLKEKFNKLNKELTTLERKQAAYKNKEETFKSEIEDIIKRAKEYSLISKDEPFNKSTLFRIKEHISNKQYINEKIDIETSEIEILRKERFKVIKKIKNIKEFQDEYEQYKKIIKNNQDSLIPIEYINENYGEIIKSPLIKDFLLILEEQLHKISKGINKRKPLDFDYKKEKKVLEDELNNINKNISLLPKENKDVIKIQEKYIFIGELKTKIDLYLDEEVEDNEYEEQIENKMREIDEIKYFVDNKEDERISTIRLLEKIIQKYLDLSADALDTYRGYDAAFNYKDKKLELQEPNTTTLSRCVGSSSNILFLHLCMFLGLHELFIVKNIPYIFSYMSLDQPSRPYYDNNSNKAKDRKKITQAIKLLNDYIDIINKKYNREFQFIVVEHIPKDIWESEQFNNIYLVDEFYGDNKLIRKCDMY